MGAAKHREVPTLRALAVALMMLLPGGLVVMAAVLLGRAVAARLRLDEGRHHRLVRAVSAVRLRDVWREAQRLV